MMRAFWEHRRTQRHRSRGQVYTGGYLSHIVPSGLTYSSDACTRNTQSHEWWFKRRVMLWGGVLWYTVDFRIKRNIHMPYTWCCLTQVILAHWSTESIKYFFLFSYIFLRNSFKDIDLFLNQIPIQILKYLSRRGQQTWLCLYSYVKTIFVLFSCYLVAPTLNKFKLKMCYTTQTMLIFASYITACDAAVTSCLDSWLLLTGWHCKCLLAKHLHITKSLLTKTLLKFEWCNPKTCQ